MQRSPPPYVFAQPDERNILNWNYIIRGPPDCPYSGGEYHGAILFPSEYPFKPPGIKMYTPSGRFQPDKKICFSMSDFHPGTWNPAWSVATILTGLLSFMLSDEMTTGSVTTSDSEKRILALKSHEWNRRQRRFTDAFPEYCTEQMKDLPNMGEKDRGVPSSPVQSPATLTAPGSSNTVPLPTDGGGGVNPVIAIPVTATAVGMAMAAPIPKPLPLIPKPVPVPAGPGWIDTWRRVVWDKWRWGILIAVAVIVSRISSP